MANKQYPDTFTYQTRYGQHDAAKIIHLKIRTCVPGAWQVAARGGGTAPRRPTARATPTHTGHWLHMKTCVDEFPI